MPSAATELITRSGFRLTHEVGRENQTFIITPPEEGASSLLAPFQSLVTTVGYGYCGSLYVEHEGEEVVELAAQPLHLLDFGAGEMDFSRTMEALDRYKDDLIRAWMFNFPYTTITSEASLSGQLVSLDGLLFSVFSMEDALARINEEASFSLQLGSFSDRGSDIGRILHRDSNVGGILHRIVPGAVRTINPEARKSAPIGPRDPFFKYDSFGLHSMRDLGLFLAAMRPRIRKLTMEHATLWGIEESLTVTVDPFGKWRIELTTRKTSEELLANIQQTLQKV